MVGSAIRVSHSLRVQHLPADQLYFSFTDGKFAGARCRMVDIPPQSVRPMASPTTHDLSAEAVNRLHAAALDPTQWPDALRQVVECLGCACICVATQEVSSPRLAHWRWCEDPAIPGPGRQGQGWWCERRAACPIGFAPALYGAARAIPDATQRVGGAPEIREWSGRVGDLPLHCFAVRLQRTETRNEFLGVQWTLARSTDHARREWLGNLIESLDCALRTAGMLDELRATVNAQRILLDQLPLGVLTLDRAGRLRYANQTANALLGAGDGLCVSDDELHAMRRGDEAHLRAFVGHPASRNTPRVLRIPRPSGRAPYALRRVIPTSVDADSEPETILIVSDPAAAPMLAKQTLRSLYGLTHTEARLARRLVAGDTVAQAAAKLRVTVGTAKIHLDHLFKKTGAHRQSELIRFLLTSPAAFNPTPPE